MKQYETVVKFYIRADPDGAMPGREVAAALRRSERFAKVERRNYGGVDEIKVRRITPFDHARGAISAQCLVLDVLHRQLDRLGFTLIACEAKTNWSEVSS